jgi:hypothetical protein
LVSDVCAEETTQDLPPSAATASVASGLSDETVVALEESKNNMSHQMSTITPVRPKYRFLKFFLLSILHLDYAEFLPQKLVAIITV